MQSPWTGRAAALATSLTAALAASCTTPADAPARLDAFDAPVVNAANAANAAKAPPAPEHHHALCGWLYEHADDADTDRGYDTFAAHADDFDAVHPKWWRVSGPTGFINHDAGRRRPFHGFHDRRVLDHTTPGGGRTRLMPLIGATAPSEIAAVHAMIHDPDLRARHLAELVRLVEDNAYDGVDLDYEHLRDAVKPPETMLAERAALTAFIEAAARALHARGKELSMAIPATSSPRSEYDLDALSAAADELHVMGYDFHYEGGDHAGPTAPLGWLRGFIDAVRSIDGGRRAARFILGLPNYGLVDRGGAVETCEPMARCFDLFQGDYATTTDELSHCSGGVDPGRSPNVSLAGGGHLFFDDLASLEEKIAAARAGGFGGVTYWGIGGEPDRPGPRSFFEMVRGYYPR
jgi:chitinase